MGRIDETRTAFDEIYRSDIWGLNTGNYAQAQPGIESEPDRNRRLAGLIGELIRLNDLRSVVEFGCGLGWCTYMKDVDFTGIQYDGFDIVQSVIDENRRDNGADNIRFHVVRDGISLPKADLLVCKDVFQHLPTADIQYYLSLFRTNFRYLLISNDIAPDDNLNGDIAAGGYRALRLERAPFNYPNVVLQQWICIDFGVRITKNFCLFTGAPQDGPADGVVLRSL